MACRAAPASTESAGPGNCANPATTEARERKADRMDVTLRFSYEAADKIQRRYPADSITSTAPACAPLAPLRTSSCADDNFFLHKGHDQTAIESLDKSKFRSRCHRMQRTKWHKKLCCHCFWQKADRSEEHTSELQS